MTTLQDGRELHYAGAIDDDDGEGDEFVPDPALFTFIGEGPEEHLMCSCGSTSFTVHFPQPVMTTARCATCKREEVVHDG